MVALIPLALVSNPEGCVVHMSSKPGEFGFGASSVHWPKVVLFHVTQLKKKEGRYFIFSQVAPRRIEPGSHNRKWTTSASFTTNISTPGKYCSHKSCWNEIRFVWRNKGASAKTYFWDNSLYFLEILATLDLGGFWLVLRLNMPKLFLEQWLD